MVNATTRESNGDDYKHMSKDSDEQMSCHSLVDALCGLLGLGEVDVEVLDNGDGQGYAEVVDGHVATDYLPSRTVVGSMWPIGWLLLQAARSIM